MENVAVSVRNVGTFLPNYTASYLGVQQFVFGAPFVAFNKIFVFFRAIYGNNVCVFKKNSPGVMHSVLKV